MPQPLNIEQLLQGDDESNMQNKLNRERMQAKKNKTPKRVSSVLGNIPSQNANSENPQGGQSNGQQSADQSAPKDQQGGKEEKTKKLGLFQFRKRQKAMQELKKLDAELNKLEKLTDKYKSTNFILLAFLASFVDMADLPISLFWATVILIPVAIILWVMKELACLFIWIKIHKIKTDQKTNDGFVWTLLAFAIESIPGVSTLPATIARVFKARNSAKAAFEKHKDEIKKIEEKMSKLIKQLG